MAWIILADKEPIPSKPIFLIPYGPLVPHALATELVIVVLVDSFGR